MKREANFQTTFNHWLKAVHKQIFVFKIPDCGFQNPFDAFSVDANGKFSAWELKQTKTNSLSFSLVVDHQVNALKRVKGFVVIKYPKFFCLIDILDWCNEVERSDRKSLTSERAKEIATIIV